MKRAITVEKLPTTKENTFLRMEVYYNEGGMNYFSGQSQKRGYYLSATPVKEEGNFTTVTAFSGTCQLLLEVKRFSQKKLQEVAADAGSQPIYPQLIAHVKSKNSLTLKSEVADAAVQATVTPVITETTQPQATV
jgi:hypothetical protein